MSGGKKTKEGREVSMFDDADFYHHLLRKLTDSAEVGRECLQIQLLRSKLKKKLTPVPPRGRRGEK